ncbi:MAG: hypothetical protein QXH42_04850 [Thermoplasmata archaeon]
MTEISVKNIWWSELRQSGMLLSPTVLEEFLPEGPVRDEYFDFRYERLRDAYTAFRTWCESRKEGDNSGLNRWLDAVLESFLRYEPRWYQKEQNVSEQFKVTSITQERLRPNRVFLLNGDERHPRFLVRIDHENPRIGVGRGRIVYSKFLELLRGTGVQIGILTNGNQLRLIYAGADYDCWCEWDTERWFEDQAGVQQLLGFYSLCGEYGTARREGADFPLLQAVLESRTRQGELSQVMGEQTREAVEEILAALDRSFRSYPALLETISRDPVSGRTIPEQEQLNALYQAAIRVMMRIVVVLFAEARELLPRSDEMYTGSYGIEGLFAQLRRCVAAEGLSELEERFYAWPRIMALFRLVHEGSPSPNHPSPAYGGSLFQRGNAKSPDPVLRALSIFEDDRAVISDYTVYEVLKRLKIGRVKAKVGRSTKWVSGPVDFSDLRTEYIGMMYEGLLDYQLRRVPPEQEAVIFLNIGAQPALPFSLLKKLEPEKLKSLLSKLKTEKTTKRIESEDEGGAESEEEAAETGEEDTGEEAEEEPPSTELETSEAFEGETQRKIQEWAVEALEKAGLLGKSRYKKYSEETQRELKLKEAARLISKIYLPGQTYLVRASGTRKGTGTFYTKPQLAVPTVRRTLEPLLYNVEGEGESRKLIPKKPEEILSVKVCDPAMGSGSFLVAALRYISDALYESLIYHTKIRDCGGGVTAVALPFGDASRGDIKEDLIPCRPDDERFEERLKSRLKRYVVERCIYGVDINPLAVELAKLSLWVETMDRELPFNFLDHKLKRGNSLVGCWFNWFREYPVMAWMREGGDKDHRGVHYQKGAWTERIKKMLNEKVKPELVRILQGQVKLDDYIFRDDSSVRRSYERAVSLFEEMHSIPLFGDGFSDRERFYRERILRDPEFIALKDAFDLWCSIWFWPADELDDNAPTPERFYRPTEVTIERSRRIAQEMGFFHWELEFPEVFMAGRGGFDAVIGNPPWEINKPISKEFFTVYDPIYRTYGKQEALTRQTELFTENQWIEQSWLHYCSKFKGMSNWTKNVGFPFGDPEEESKGGAPFNLSVKKVNDMLHRAWREKRMRTMGYSDPEHPFRYQGSADINTYKMFLEIAYAILKKGGRFGIIVPSGIYTDNGTTTLRRLFIEKSKWEWLFGFENRKGIFDIHRSFKFCPIIVEKGGKTTAIKTAFMRHDLSEWESPSPTTILYSIEDIKRFSPKSMAILEIRTERDLAILKKIYSNSILLGDQSPDGWQIQYTTEFHMTNDSHLFPPRTWWEELGYRPDPYGRWLPPKSQKPKLIYKGKEIGPPGDIGLPLYQGVMIWQYNFNAAIYINGAGNNAKWKKNDWYEIEFKPQFILPQNEYIFRNRAIKDYKVVVRRITCATNERTIISSLLFSFPCGDKASIVNPIKRENRYLFIANINSFVFDNIARNKLPSTQADYHVLADLPLIPINILLKFKKYIIYFTISLNASHILFSPIWLEFKKQFIEYSKKVWYSLWAITLHERYRFRCMIDAIFAELYNLNYLDLAWILRDCAWPNDEIKKRQQTFDPKGFWRVDKDKDPELRHTVLTLRAFADLKKMIEEHGGDREKGIRAFCEQNDGEGWMIPETITYKQDEQGLIVFDTPDGKTVPVRSRLGDRFLPWQLEKTPEESWKECEMHARNILGDEEFEKFMKKIEEGVGESQFGTNICRKFEKSEIENIGKKKDNVQKDLLQY